MATSKLSLAQPLHKTLISCEPSSVFNMAQRLSCSKETLVEISQLLGDFARRGCLINPLQAAVMVGNYRICKQLLQEGADMLSPSTVPPPLFIALDLDRFQIARLLIDSGAAVFLSHQHMYPMYFAIKQNSPEFIVEAIIKAGFPPDSIIEEKFCNTALLKAVGSNNVGVVKVLTKLKVNCNAKETHLGFTPLHVAINLKLPPIAQILIDNGADLEAEDKAGLTPLFHAILQNDIFFVNFLLQCGANIHHLCSDVLEFPLNVAASTGNVAIVEALLRHGADPSRFAPGTGNLPLHSVALSKNGKTSDCAEQLRDIAELLIQNGSEVDVPNIDGYTPVKLALLKHNFKVVEALISEGAAINHDFEQGSSFHYVSKVGNKELVSLFLEYGADYSTLDQDGTTAYNLSMFNHDPNVLKTFWKFGCPFDLSSNGPACSPSYPSEMFIKLDNQKKFMLGMKQNDVSMVLSALQNGAEVRGTSTVIPYPLHYTVSNGFSSIVLLLLQNGVPSNSINHKGESPLHIAARKGYFQICCYLLKYGACYDSLTKPAAKTPLDLALENSHFEVVSILREIDRMFKSSANTSFEELQGTFEKSNNLQCLQVYINSINREGNTLMAVALKVNNRELAANLMKVRMQIIKA